MFEGYREQLRGEVDQAEFNTNLNAALDTLESCLSRATDVRLATDVRDLGYAVENSGFPRAKDIAESFYVGPGNNSGYPPNDTRAQMSPAFDTFTFSGVPCATYIARLVPHNYQTSFNVFRIVAATTGQRTLPDARGIYVARSTVDQTIVMFNAVHHKRDAASTMTTTVRRITDQEQKDAVLAELQKGAGVALEASRRGTQRR